jgi:hypothetical protein
MPITRLALLASLALASPLAIAPAHALTMKECSAKYNAAKEAGTLGNMKWNDFRKTQCGTDAAAAAATPDATSPEKKAKTSTAKAQTGTTDQAKGLTQAQCSAKYQAAKEAGTLGGMKWNDFRKTQCGADATAAAATPDAAKPDKKAKTSTAKADTATTDQAKGLTMTQCSAKYKAAQEADATSLKWNDFRKAECGPGADPEALTSNDAKEPPAATIAAPKGVAFPRSVSSKYAGETAAKARMHTCLDQYYADKSNNTLGGLKWIQKGGGYYSLCNTKLKS